jgi:sugar/nucleoside kinase (ribokinase family)
MSARPTVVVGDLMVDVVAVALEPVAHGSDAAARVIWRGGGAGANVAAWLAAAGGAPVLVARAGDDVAGRAAVADLRAAGVDARVTIDPERATGTCVVVVGAEGERTMLPDRGANLGLRPEDLPGDVFVAGAHLHLSGYVLLHPAGRPAGLAALERSRATGMTISVDPASAAPLAAGPPDAFLAWVRGVDWLLPNREEAAVLTGEADPARAARELVRRARLREVVVTLGAEGAVWSDGERIARQPAMPAIVKDTTGAGDAFAAAWIAARGDGAAPEEALRAACARGSEAVVRAGARP